MSKYKCPYDHDQPEFRLEWYEENFEKLMNERDDALTEIEMLKQDIVDYVIEKDDEINSLKRALEAL